MSYEVLQVLALLCQAEYIQTQTNCQAYYIDCMEKAQSYSPSVVAECVKKADKKMQKDLGR